MVFDDWQNGIPVAFVITARSRQNDLEPWMEALNAKLIEASPDWHPNTFIVDNVQADANAIRWVLFLPSLTLIQMPCSATYYNMFFVSTLGHI